jgi:hypothetical protein
MLWERNIEERWDGDKYRYQKNNGKGEEGGGCVNTEDMQEIIFYKT